MFSYTFYIYFVVPPKRVTPRRRPYQRGNKNGEAQTQQLGSAGGEAVEVSGEATSASSEQGVTRSEFQVLKDSVSSLKVLLESVVNDSTSGQSLGRKVVQPSSATAEVPLPVATQANTDIHDARLSRVYQAHVADITGERQSNGGLVGHLTHQVDYQVSTKMMQDIWNNVFIDFSLLLDLKSEGPQGFVWEQCAVGEAPRLVPARSKKQISNITQWSQAWDIYMSVYSRRYPEQTHNLVTYSSKVKDLAAKGGDFLKYDTGFRKARARFMSPWEIPDLELWL